MSAACARRSGPKVREPSVHGLQYRGVVLTAARAWPGCSNRVTRECAGNALLRQQSEGCTRWAQRPAGPTRVRAVSIVVVRFDRRRVGEGLSQAVPHTGGHSASSADWGVDEQTQLGTRRPCFFRGVVPVEPCALFDRFYEPGGSRPYVQGTATLAGTACSRLDRTFLVIGDSLSCY
jgi:hypothetical protein